MKKCLAIILALVMAFGCMSVAAFAADPAVLTGFAGGNGSAENPYQIATKAQLENLADIVNSGNGCADTYFVLTADIGTETEPVTSIISIDYFIPFKGNFDGQNHTVTLNITSDASYCGLFGCCSSATIANVTTAGSVTPEGVNCSGGVCGFNNNGTIINCHNSATLSGSNIVGGICGRNYQGTILNCSNSGSVSGLMCAGGVCGANEFDADSTSESTIVNCFNSGAVTGDWTAGGICGSTAFLCTVKNCYNSGEVTASNNCGGAFGADGGSIINVFYDSDVCANAGSADATGLTTEQCKGKPGTENALVDKLNGYKENDSYPEGWLNWVIDSTTGYPTIVVRSNFLTSFTLNKDYNDKYTADTKSTKVNETVTFTITPVTTGAPTFDDNGVFTMTVTDGVGSAEVDLPDLTGVTSVGDYWYKIEETEGTTAGVTYNDTTYYLHLIVSYKNGEFGFSSAVVRSSSDVTATDGEYPTTGKIDTVSNTYGEGSLTVTQEATVNGEESSEDTFTAKVTFTPAEGTDDVGTITYGDGQTVTKNTDGKYVVDVELKGGESVTFNNIPDGVTYTVEQSEGNEDKGYQLDDVAFDNEDEDGDTVTDNIASGTIGDSADTVTINNSKTVPVDVGVIVEYTAFIILALGAVAAGAWLVISRKRKTIEAE